MYPLILRHRIQFVSLFTIPFPFLALDQGPPPSTPFQHFNPGSTAMANQNLVWAAGFFPKATLEFLAFKPPFYSEDHIKGSSDPTYLVLSASLKAHTSTYLGTCMENQNCTGWRNMFASLHLQSSEFSCNHATTFVLKR